MHGNTDAKKLIYLSVLKISRRQNSIKCSQGDRRLKIWKFSDVSETDSVSIFRVLLIAW